MMASTDPWWWGNGFFTSNPYQQTAAKEKAAQDADPGAPHDAGPYASAAIAKAQGPAQYAANVKASKSNQPNLNAVGWFYDSIDKTARQMTGTQAAQVNASRGFNAVIGPYATKALALSEGPAGTFPNPNSNPVVDAGVNAVGSVLDSVTSGFLGALENKALWTRVAEVVLGLVLIAVGLSRLTHAGGAIGAAAKTAAKVAVI